MLDEVDRRIVDALEILGILVLLLARPYSEAINAVQETVLPMIMANALGLVIFALTFSRGIKETEREEKFMEHIAMSGRLIA